MKEKRGATFLVALGFFIIATSPLMGNKYLQIISGFACLGLGFYLMKKN